MFIQINILINFVFLFENIRYYNKNYMREKLTILNLL